MASVMVPRAPVSPGQARQALRPCQVRARVGQYGGVTTNRSPVTLLAEAAFAAGRAPSVHNTQPWRWLVQDGWMDLYADRDRQLAVADPDGRLLMISCGTALHHARVTLAAAGFRGLVQRHPTNDPDHLARIKLGERIGVSPAAIRRFQCIQYRRTDRRTVIDKTPIEDLAAIRAAVEEEHSHLHVLRNDQVSELAVAAARAATLEAADPDRRAELSYWVAAPRPGTGVPKHAILRHRPHTDLPMRDFGPGSLTAGAEQDQGASYAVIFGATEGPPGWMRTGEALSAAWLTATERGVSLVPFSTVVEAPAPRAILRRLLGGLGHPQLMLRLGLVDPERAGPPVGPRLDGTQVVEIAENGAKRSR